MDITQLFRLSYRFVLMQIHFCLENVVADGLGFSK